MTTENSAAVQAEIDHAISTLTAEERAAMADDDAPNVDVLKAVAGSDADADGDDDDDDDDGEEDGAPVEGAAAAPAPAPAPAAPATAPAPAPAPDQVAQDEEDDAPLPPAIKFDLPADFEQQLADVKAAKAAVYQRLKGGEISIEDLPAELESLDAQQRKLDSMQTKFEVSQQAEQATADAYQRREIDRAFKVAKSQGIDYKGVDADKVADLDMFMKALAKKDENADKPYKWFLAEAHKRVLAMHGKSPTPAPAPSPAPAPGAKTPSRKPPVEAAPVTLANVPGGDGPGDVGGEFADVLALEGEAYEAAISAMAKRDPAKFERFQSA